MNISDPEILKQIIDVLSKSPPNRTQHEISFLVQVTIQIPFFQKLNQDSQNEFIHREACKNMRIRLYQVGETAINFGEVGEEFFLILKGKAAVYVPVKSNNPANESKESEFRKMLGKKIKSFQKKLLKFQRTEEGDIKKLYNEHILRRSVLLRRSDSKLDVGFLKNFGEIEGFKEVGQLLEGNSFGELSLISDKPRAATIICQDYCIFAVLFKSDFVKILRAQSERILHEKTTFLQQLPIFSSCSRFSLQKFSYYLSEIRFAKNQQVYVKGDLVDFVYFVISGEFKLTRQNKVQSVFSRSVKLKNCREVVKSSDLVYSIKTKFEILGSEEIILNCITRRYSLTCISMSGSLYSFPKDEFKARITSPDLADYVLEKKNYLNLRENEMAASEKVCSDIYPKEVPRHIIKKEEEPSEIRKTIKNFSINLKNLKCPQISPRREANSTVKKGAKSAFQSPETSLSPTIIQTSSIKSLPKPNIFIGNLSRFLKFPAYNPRKVVFNNNSCQN